MLVRRLRRRKSYGLKEKLRAEGAEWVRSRKQNRFVIGARYQKLCIYDATLLHLDAHLCKLLHTWVEVKQIDIAIYIYVYPAAGNFLSARRLGVARQR